MFNQDGTPAMSTTTLDLARQWGIDARNAGLDRDTLTTDREAVRAIRDAAHDEGHADAYTVSGPQVVAAWGQGYDAPTARPTWDIEPNPADYPTAPAPVTLGGVVSLLAAHSEPSGGDYEQWLEVSPEGEPTALHFTWGWDDYSADDAERAVYILRECEPFGVNPDETPATEGVVGGGQVFWDESDNTLAIESGNGFEYYAALDPFEVAEAEYAPHDDEFPAGGSHSEIREYIENLIVLPEHPVRFPGRHDLEDNGSIQAVCIRAVMMGA